MHGFEKFFLLKHCILILIGKYIIILKNCSKEKAMQLTRIDILKYKSIKNPVSVYFNEGKVVSLIGKNGSGKTNVLEAIKYAFSKNQFYGREKIECEIKYHIELTDEELEEYFSCVQTEDREKEIIVDFNCNNLERRLVFSSSISIEAKIFKERLDAVLANFEIAAKNYITALHKVETDRNYFGNYIDVQVEEENRGSLSYLTAENIKWVQDSIKRNIDEIKRYIDRIFDGDKISLSRYDHIGSFYLDSDYIKFYKIAEDEQINISPILASSLKISKDELKKANRRLNRKIKFINKTLKKEYAEIQQQIEEFKKIKNEIDDIFRIESDKFNEQNEELNKKFKSVIQKLRELVFCNCYYLDNENSLIFYNSFNRNYRNEQVQQEYLNSRNPIVEAFDMFLRNRKIIDCEASITQKEKIDDKTIAKAVSVLNSQFFPGILPKFDNNEILKYEVRNENSTLNLYVHEKNGDIVSFNDTSLGRRWYLTYQFVKALLKPGDMLLIDEPAAFLHPQAQVEFKKELGLLADNGICVFYSTHSPYMIPDNWGQVYNVTMTDNGTQLTKFESGDDLCEIIINELGATNTANILFNLGKTILLVEGIADLTCIEKFAKILGYSLDSYKILPCNGSPIFDVTYLCIHQHIKFKALFDLDNKNKPEMWMNKKYGYNEYIKIFDKNENCVFTPEIRHKKSIEDCFHENDSARYFSDYKRTDKHNVEHCERKIDVEKIKRATEFEEETKNNFEQLFNQLGIPKLDETNI